MVAKIVQYSDGTKLQTEIERTGDVTHVWTKSPFWKVKMVGISDRTKLAKKDVRISYRNGRNWRLECHELIY